VCLHNPKESPLKLLKNHSIINNTIQPNSLDSRHGAEPPQHQSNIRHTTNISQAHSISKTSQSACTAGKSTTITHPHHLWAFHGAPRSSKDTMLPEEVLSIGTKNEEEEE
jgi:hypothetical protein